MTVFDIDPNVVKPGWTPFIITLMLAAVMVFLYRSMRHQFSRIRVPRAEDVNGSAAPTSSSATSRTEQTDSVRTGPSADRRTPRSPED